MLLLSKHPPLSLDLVIDAVRIHWDGFLQLLSIGLHQNWGWSSTLVRGPLFLMYLLYAYLLFLDKRALVEMVNEVPV